MPSLRFLPLVLLLTLLGCGGAAPGRVEAPTHLAYPQPLVVGITGQPLATALPTVTGTVRAFSIAPALPPGLAFNTGNGAITGTPTKPLAETTFTVVAQNETGFAATQWRLTVAGLTPDLRFQWTGAFDAYVSGSAELSLGTPPPGSGGVAFTYSGLLHFGPLQISSPTGDGWSCLGVGVDVPLLGGTRSTYTAKHLDTLDQHLDDFAAQGMIVTSLDLSVRGFGVVATGPQDNLSEYRSARTTVADLTGLAALAAVLGQQGGVLTALATTGKTYANTPGTGPILALWSHRQSDIGTYEVQVISGTAAELRQRLPDLGQQGYVITAFGAGDQLNYIAVGTRPTGTTTPHSIYLTGFGGSPGPGLSGGYMVIGRMFDPSGITHHWVLQR